ncbi:MAG TPA: hypothetical protein VGE51_11565 [Fontimonas sp.]
MKRVAVCAAFLTIQAPFALAESKTLPCAETQVVSYDEPVLKIAEYIALSPAPQIEPVAIADRAAWTWSPHQTSAYRFRQKADFSVDGPWTSIVDISGSQAHPVRLTLTFPNHGHVAPELTWLNENWLFVQLWLGRMVDASLIIDVDRKKIIQEEQGSHHLMFEPCE